MARLSQRPFQMVQRQRPPTTIQRIGQQPQTARHLHPIRRADVQPA